MYYPATSRQCMCTTRVRVQTRIAPVRHVRTQFSQQQKALQGKRSSALAYLQRGGSTGRTLQQPVSCDAGKEDEGSTFSDDDFQKLAARVDQLRSKEITTDRVSAHNWRKGRCSHTLFCVLDEYVRHLKVVGETVACGTHTGVCYLINMTTGQVQAKLVGMEAEITCLDFDGKWLTAGGARGEVWLWDITSKEGVMVCKHDDRCISAQLLGDGKVLSASFTGQLCVSDASNAELMCLATNAHMGCMRYTNGYAIAGMADGRVVVYLTSNFKQILAFTAHQAPVICLQMVIDEDLNQDVLVTGDGGGVLKSWDFNEGSALHTFVGHRAPITCLQFDSTKLVSGSRDGSIRVWDLRSGESLYGMYGYTGYIAALQFDKNILISDGTNNVIGYHDFADEAGITNMNSEDLDC